MRIIYLLPIFSMSLFAHSNNNILHYHYAEYLFYLLAGVTILRIFLRRVN